MDAKAKHGGCIVCGGKSEPILTSGHRPPSEGKPLGESVAVCSRPECRKEVNFT